jgi:VIT1/CCC1 family predicted Fe2+/Mn2+ transporter
MPLFRTGEPEGHYTQRIGWLRAAVLGANDGIVSTASLVVGVAAAEGGRGQILLAGVAGLVAGAMSMAAGEYVSVSSQSDTETADLERERRELDADEDFERAELAAIYVQRGLDEQLAKEVAQQLMAHDALGAHARDELGLTEIHSARPTQAAVSSAAAFAVGAALPLGVAAVTSGAWLGPAVSGASLGALGVLGALAARVGGASVARGAVRVMFWGALAMGVTALVGRMFGAIV